MQESYTSETPTGVKLVGSSNAGGAEYVSTQNLFSGIGNVMHFFREYGSREENSYFNTRGMDHQHKPPKWMEHKDVAVDGTPLTTEQRRAPGYWERVYEKELAVGQAIAVTKQKKRFESVHTLWGGVNKMLRRYGMAEPLQEKGAIKNALTSLEEKILEEDIVKGGSGGATPTSASAAWEALVVSIETNRPMAKVAQEYRPKVDFYGIDPFLDSAPSFMWFCTKIGMFVGVAHGTAKTMQVINVDAQYLRASGVGMISLLNVTVLASVIKWGGNIGLFSAAFVIGDRLATYVKHSAYPTHDATQRSMLNYSMGLSLSCATIGTLPWWLLNDVRFAARLAASGMFVGAGLGMFVGFAMDRLVALNIGRIDASNRDMRRFEALMKREALWLEHEKRKTQDNTKSLLF